MQGIPPIPPSQPLGSGAIILNEVVFAPPGPEDFPKDLIVNTDAPVEPQLGIGPGESNRSEPIAYSYLIRGLKE